MEKKIRIITKNNSPHKISKPSGYQTDPDIGIPKKYTKSSTRATTREVNNSEPHDAVPGSQNHLVTGRQSNSTQNHSLELLLRRNPDVIFNSTPANRPRRQTKRPDRYQ